MHVTSRGFPLFLTFDLDAETMWTARDPSFAQRPAAEDGGEVRGRVHGHGDDHHGDERDLGEAPAVERVGVEVLVGAPQHPHQRREGDRPDEVEQQRREPADLLAQAVGSPEERERGAPRRAICCFVSSIICSNDCRNLGFNRRHCSKSCCASLARPCRKRTIPREA